MAYFIMILHDELNASQVLSTVKLLPKGSCGTPHNVDSTLAHLNLSWSPPRIR